ncbi:unnamed protein product [Dracunculus medinensis]|uniref:Uncharacterized protein n=1 Tax=Dracunculus medinensis TaxID=318479 RepID=A0A0N4UHZ7_DRAME|nr:unnamed protein product [Dracunculus medinensis]
MFIDLTFILQLQLVNWKLFDFISGRLRGCPTWSEGCASHNEDVLTVKAPEQSKIFRARPLLRTKLIVAIEMEMCSIYDHLHNSVQSLGKIAKALNEFDCKPNISFTFKVDMKYILIYLEEVINWWAKHNCCDFYLHRALRFESPNQRTQKAICRVKNDLSLSTRYKIEII